MRLTAIFTIFVCVIAFRNPVNGAGGQGSGESSHGPSAPPPLPSWIMPLTIKHTDSPHPVYCSVALITPSFFIMDAGGFLQYQARPGALVTLNINDKLYGLAQHPIPIGHGSFYLGKLQNPVPVEKFALPHIEIPGSGKPVPEQGIAAVIEPQNDFIFANVKIAGLVGHRHKSWTNVPKFVAASDSKLMLGAVYYTHIRNEESDSYFLHGLSKKEEASNSQYYRYEYTNLHYYSKEISRVINQSTN